MIQVYLLPVKKTDNTEAVAGTDVIHDAVLECTENPLIRKLLMNTTPNEHTALSLLAISISDPTQQEQDIFNARNITPPPDPDAAYITSVLQQSPPSIPMPDIWKLLRIFAQRLGFK